MKAWIIFVLAVAPIIFAIWLAQGPRRAVAAALLLGLLVPEWVRLDVSPTLWATARLTLVIFSLILYLFHPKSTYNFKLIWSDYAMIGMIAVHVISDVLRDGVGMAPFLRAYGEWFVPYIAGRIAIQTMSDARWTLPLVVGVVGLLTLLAVGEAVARLTPNPQEAFAGARPVGYAKRDTVRLGLKRAYGPTLHPLFLSGMLFCTVPWLVYAASRAWRKQAPQWWIVAPGLAVVAMVSTVSRGPLLALAIIAFVMQLILYPARRTLLAPLGAVVIGGIMLFGDEAIDVFESFTPEAVYNSVAIVDGKEEKWTSTRHRILLIREYDSAVLKGGLFGWGTRNCNTFPLNVPHEKPPPKIDMETGELIAEPSSLPTPPKKSNDPFAPKVRKTNYVQLDTVDNAYLLYAIRFGFLGLGCFVALNLAGAYQFVKLAIEPKAEGVVWLAAMAGAVCGMMFILVTVFLPPDFAVIYLFMIGSSAGLLAEKENPLVHLAEKPLEKERPRHRRRHRRRRSKSEEHAQEEESTEQD